MLLFASSYSYLTIKRNQVWKNSETLWTDAAKKYPSNIAFMNLGEYHLERGLYDRAIEEFKIAYKLSPNEYHPLYNIGLAYLKKGNYDKAITDFTKAIEIDPTYAKAYYNRGVAWARKGDYAKAKAEYAKAKELGN